MGLQEAHPIALLDQANPICSLAPHEFSPTPMRACCRFPDPLSYPADNIIEQAPHLPIKPGSKGDDVQRIQKLLIAKGFDLDVDGDFGPKTEAAVRSFQTSSGLTVDGIVGQKTWEVLSIA